MCGPSALDDFGLPRVDLIKIDVEGMELEALEGAATRSQAHPIMLIEENQGRRRQAAHLA